MLQVAKFVPVGVAAAALDETPPDGLVEVTRVLDHPVAGPRLLPGGEVPNWPRRGLQGFFRGNLAP